MSVTKVQLVGNVSTGASFAGIVTATSLIPTGSTVPTNGVYLPAANTLGFAANNTERARIDSSGKLLVGTSSALTSVVGFVPSIQLSTTNASSASISITSTSNDAFSGGLICGKSRAGSAVQENDGLGQFRFGGFDGSAYVESVRIIAEVDGTPGTDDMPGRLVFSTTADGASSPTERMRINNAGSVMINTTSGEGGHLLSVAGNGVTSAVFRRNSDNGSVHSFMRDSSFVGSISVTTTATAFNTSSDYRLKENVIPLTGAIKRLQQIPVHRFNFIADPNTVVDGFIAHEAQEVVPECVTGTKDEVDEDGNPIYQGIDQSKLVPLLTAALQEALQKIEDLEGRLTAAGL
jgi:hypothetical protein